MGLLGIRALAAGLEGDFGEFLGGVEVVAGGAVVVAGAGEVGLQEIALVQAAGDGDLAMAVGGVRSAGLDDVELVADDVDERGGVAPGGVGDGVFPLQGEFAEDQQAVIDDAVQQAFFPAVGGVDGEAVGVGNAGGQERVADDGTNAGEANAEGGFEFVEGLADGGGGPGAAALGLVGVGIAGFQRGDVRLDEGEEWSGSLNGSAGRRAASTAMTSSPCARARLTDRLLNMTARNNRPSG